MRKNQKKFYKHSSEILLEFARNKNLDGNLTYQDLISSLGERAFGVVLLFFSLPTVLPLSTLPGISLVFSLPIIIFASQMIIKRKSLWLPKIIANHTISHKQISIIIKVAVPYLTLLERFSKPRWMWMSSGVMEIMNGLALLFLSILLILPVPFSNFIFGGIILIFSLGIAEKDGIFVSLGYACFSLYISFIYLLTVITLDFYYSLFPHS